MEHIIDDREDKFLTLKKLAQELYIPIPEVFLTIEVKNSEMISKETTRSHTYVRNFYNQLFASVIGQPTATGSYGAGSLIQKYDQGGYETSPLASYWANIVYNASSNANGIQIGTSDQAYSFEDYKLIGLIAHGTGSGQMTYNAMSHQTPAYTTGTKTWTQDVTRKFNNNSSGSITVKEVALVGGTIPYIRDVLASSKTVAVGAQLTVTYTFSMTFPA